MISQQGTHFKVLQVKVCRLLSDFYFSRKFVLFLVKMNVTLNKLFKLQGGLQCIAKSEYLAEYRLLFWRTIEVQASYNFQHITALYANEHEVSFKREIQVLILPCCMEFAQDIASFDNEIPECVLKFNGFLVKCTKIVPLTISIL